MNDIVGVDEEAINSLVTNIANAEEALNTIFNSMDDEIEQLSNGFKCPASNVFKTKYASLQKNFATIRDNLRSYMNDLILLKENMEEITQKKATKVVENGIESVKSIAEKN